LDFFDFFDFFDFLDFLDFLPLRLPPRATYSLRAVCFVVGEIPLIRLDAPIVEGGNWGAVAPVVTGGVFFATTTSFKGAPVEGEGLLSGKTGLFPNILDNQLI
jgi:hypothetical protein